MIHGGVAKPASGIAWFPLLAVALCTAGALVAVLGATAQRARLRARQATAVAEPQEDMTAEIEAAGWRTSHLQESRAKTEAQLAEARLQLSHIEDHLRRMRDECERLKLAAVEMERLGSSRSANRDTAAAELESLKSQIRRAERELARAESETVNRPATYSVIPYQGPNQTRRRPIYIECRADAVILQPEGIPLTEDDFAGPLGPGNPLAAAMRAQREHIMAQQAAGGEKAEPYPLLLVRPDGITSYYAARAALTSWGSEFGYELVGENWKLEYPTADMKLAETVQHTITEARLRQQQLVMSAPRAYGRGGGKAAMRASPTRGGFVADKSSGGGGSGSNRGGYAGAGKWGGGGTSTGSGGAGGSGEPGGAGGATVAESFGSSLGGGNGRGATTGGPGSPGSAASGGMSPGGVANGSGGTGAGGSNILAGNNVGGASGNQSASGSNRYANANGGGSAAQGYAQGGPGGTPSGGASRAGASGSRSTSGGAAGGNGQSGGNSASGGSSSGSSGGQSGGGGSSGSGDPNSASPSPTINANKSNKSESLANKRGRDWGLPDAAQGSVAITRPVMIECRADRIVITPESGTGGGKEVMLRERTQDSVEDLVSSVWEHMKTWGIAGRGLYWKPILSMDVAPDAEARYQELESLLADSGLEVRRRQKSVATAPSNTKRK